jgi:hexosaminidase
MPAAALALVPYPRAVRPLAGAPFRLSPGVVPTGPAEAVAALVDAVAARTGIRISPAPEADPGSAPADPASAAADPASAPADPASDPEAQRRRSGAPRRDTAADGGVSATIPAVVSGIRLAVMGRGAPEAYRIRVDATEVWIEGADAAGLGHGIHTLVQLLIRDGDAWTVPAIEIEDAPRFAHRGLMLDVARHFFPVDAVVRLIDHAAALKLNVLHLHLSDDQGWRLALSSRPELAARASGTSVGGDPGGCYTAADYRTITAYAARHHMTVIPEIDGPGHTHAVGLAYPELAAEPTVTDDVLDAVHTFGGGVPTPGEPYTGLAVGFSSLRIGTPEVDAFLTDVFTELAALTPGPYLHVGGDEALGTSDVDYAAYIATVTGLVAGLGKIPIAWHEAGSAASPGTVGQYWGFARAAADRGTAAADRDTDTDTGTAGTHTDTADRDSAGDKLRAFVRGGGRVILSPADTVYLDMKPRPDAPLGLAWANGPTSVERSYRWEPTMVVPGIAERDILGVEAALWTETIRTEADIEAMVFPRLASAAEIAWSPAEGPERTWPSFRDRVAGLGHAWDAAGIGFDRAPEVPWRGE